MNQAYSEAFGSGSRVLNICRTEETAAVSEIRRIAYTPADVMRLFSAFRAEVDKTLLFLKVSCFNSPFGCLTNGSLWRYGCARL